MTRLTSQPPAELPIACSLEPASSRERIARWRALAERTSPVMNRTGDQIVIRYEARPGVLTELRELAAAERDCCKFADWEVTDDGRWARLQIRSDPEGLASIAPLLEAE